MSFFKKFLEVPKHEEWQEMKEHIATINEELGAIKMSQSTIQNDLEWVKNHIIPRIEKELWLVFSAIILAALAFWLFK